MKSCPQCQYPNPDSRTDCFKCSAPLDGRAAAKEPPPQQPVSTSPFTTVGPYSGPGQPPPGYQNPNSTYSTPIIMPIAHTPPVNRGLWTGLAVVFVCLMFMGIRMYLNHATVAAINKGASSNKYTVLSCVPKLNSIGMPTISGQICNNSNKDVLLATATIDMFDANGKNIGTTLATTMNWLPNQNWDYEALLEDPTVASSVATAKVVKVTMMSERQ